MDEIIKILREHAEQQDYPVNRRVLPSGECANVDKCPYQESHWAEVDYSFEQGFKLGLKLGFECH